MRYWIGIICFFPLMACAANWMEVGTSGNNLIEMDADSIQKMNETTVKAWFRENTLARRKNVAGRYYRTVITQEVFQCDKRMMTVEKALYFEDTMATQLVDDIDIKVTDSDFTAVIPGSLGELKYKAACNKTK